MKARKGAVPGGLGLLVMRFLSLILLELAWRKRTIGQPQQPNDTATNTTTTTAVFPCLDPSSNNNKLQAGWAIENGVCVNASTSVFFYAIQLAPISTNGLQAGAPTDPHVWFGSLGNNAADAFDPQNYGLSIPPAGRLILDLSTHFPGRPTVSPEVLLLSE